LATEGDDNIMAGNKYTLIGDNGQTYGPVDIVVLQTWARSNRIDANSRLLDDLTAEIVRAESIPALKSYLQTIPPTKPPVVQQQTAPQQPVVDPTVSGGQGTTIQIINNIQSNNAGVQPFAGGVAHIAPKSKLVAGVLALFLGALGIHRFYLGYSSIGAAMLLITLLTCGWGGILVAIWALVEAVIIFTGGMRDSNGMELVA
jgi:hypothetical protein